MICPRCEEEPKTKLDLEWLERFGICGGCDRELVAASVVEGYNKPREERDE